MCNIQQTKKIKKILPLCSGEIPPEVLHPVLGSLAQEGDEPVAASLERGGHQVREMEHLSCGERLRMGIFHPGKEKALG